MIGACVQLDGGDDIKKAQEQLNKQLFEMDNNLQRIAAPNMKALEKYLTFYTLIVLIGRRHLNQTVLTWEFPVLNVYLLV